MNERVRTPIYSDKIRLLCCPEISRPEFNPQIIIEAKITEDDSTARDKVTRIQHFGELSLTGRSANNPKYEVIACIGGRGFGVRREDMKKLILATRGTDNVLFYLQHMCLTC